MWYSQPGAEINAFQIMGIVVWITGQIFEIMGDAQLTAFIKMDPKLKTTNVITTGLWRYTRHPNYFGEAFTWWGIYIIACGVKEGYWTFFSALSITFLIRFFSGVPILEESQKARKP